MLPRTATWRNNSCVVVRNWRVFLCFLHESHFQPALHRYYAMEIVLTRRSFASAHFPRPLLHSMPPSTVLACPCCWPLLAVHFPSTSLALTGKMRFHVFWCVARARVAREARSGKKHPDFHKSNDVFWIRRQIRHGNSSTSLPRSRVR